VAGELLFSGTRAQKKNQRAKEQTNLPAINATE
jgi:hypothetical protein